MDFGKIMNTKALGFYVKKTQFLKAFLKKTKNMDMELNFQLKTIKIMILLLIQ